MSDTAWTDAGMPVVPVSNEAEYLASMRLRRALRATATTAHDEQELWALERAIEAYEGGRSPLTLASEGIAPARTASQVIAGP